MARAYRKKPVVVEAIQWTGKNLQELKNFVGDSLEYDVMDAAWEVGKGPVIVNVRIQTLEGIHHASVGDFIIKGIRGEFYPCKPDIFAKTYESASLTPPNEWVSVEDAMPPEHEPVLCIVDGKPKPNITLEDAYQLGSWNKADGWIIDEWLDWEGANVTWWMKLPETPYRRPPEGETDE